MVVVVLPKLNSHSWWMYGRATLLHAATILSVLQQHTPDEAYRCTSLENGLRLVTFAGTRNWRDVLDDLDIRSCPWVTRMGRVHCGIAHRTRRLWENPDLQEFCTEGAASPSSPLILGGYSLGGGVSVCAAALLREHEGIVPSRVITFGAPKIGDAAFQRWYASTGLWQNTRRYTTPYDPIPRLPPQSTYRHVGRRVVLPLLLHSDGVDTVEEVDEPDKSTLRSTSSMFAAHSLDTYVACIQELSNT